jgi:hypothetical protein
MREDETAGVFYTRPCVWGEPRGRTRVLLLATVALASLIANAVGLLIVFRGGA